MMINTLGRWTAYASTATWKIVSNANKQLKDLTSLDGSLLDQRGSAMGATLTSREESPGSSGLSPDIGEACIDIITSQREIRLACPDGESG